MPVQPVVKADNLYLPCIPVGISASINTDLSRTVWDTPYLSLTRLLTDPQGVNGNLAASLLLEIEAAQIIGILGRAQNRSLLECSVLPVTKL